MRGFRAALTRLQRRTAPHTASQTLPPALTVLDVTVSANLFDHFIIADQAQNGLMLNFQGLQECTENRSEIGPRARHVLDPPEGSFRMRSDGVPGSVAFHREWASSYPDGSLLVGLRGGCSREDQQERPTPPHERAPHHHLLFLTSALVKKSCGDARTLKARCNAPRCFAPAIARRSVIHPRRASEQVRNPREQRWPESRMLRVNCVHPINQEDTGK